MSEDYKAQLMAKFEANVAEYEARAKRGPSIKREHAAQLAESAWGALTSTGDQNALWLDGCLAGIEKAAEIIRRDEK
jgi:hypothetical protein